MSNIIVMAFSPRNIVLGCLFKKRLTKGGHGHPRTPPRYALAPLVLLPCIGSKLSVIFIIAVTKQIDRDMTKQPSHQISMIWTFIVRF